MSDFWEKNKDSIKSGLLTAGKYGYQGTKYVAKTGYHMGKSQYDAHKGKGHNNNNNTTPGTEKNDTLSIERLNDPKNFPAPPLRQGQKQYIGNGQIVCAEDAPILNIPPGSQTVSQPIVNMGSQYQNQPQNTYGNYQYGTTNNLQLNMYQQQGSSQPIPHNVISQSPDGQYITQHKEPSISTQNYMPTANSQDHIHSQQLGNIPLQTQHMQPVPPFRPQPLPNEVQRPSPPPPPRPPIPSRQQTNDFETSMSISSTSSSVGPHFEVKPFNREEYEEMKKQQAIVLPQVDLSKVAPPPMHKDRGSTESSARNSPSFTTKTSHSGIPSKSSSSSIVGSSSSIDPIVALDNAESHKTLTVERSEPLSITDNSVENLEHNMKEREEVNSTVSGTYHEPVVNFAPPPQPHRRIYDGGNTPVNTGYSPKVYSSTSVNNHQAVSQPPPLLPKRNANRISETNSSQSIEYNPEEKNLDNYDIQTNNSITGVYTERNINFQPPPKPFKRDSNIREDRGLASRSTSGYGETPFAQTLPERHKQTAQISKDSEVVNNTETSHKEELSTKPAVHPASEVVPPSKPFGLASLKNTPHDKTNELQEHGQPEDHHNDLSNKQSGFKPSFDQTVINNISNRSTDKTIPVYNLSASNPPDNSSHIFIQELNSTISDMSINSTRKHKSIPPPPVKTKPPSLNNVSLEKLHSVSIQKNHSEPSKRPPPVVKPKPKNLENILKNDDTANKTSINSHKTSVTNSMLDHIPVERTARESSQFHSPLIREQPPIPPSRRAQPPIPPSKRETPPIPKYHNDTFVPTNRRARMPLPNEISDSSKDATGSQSNDDDTNPFAIYKKEAVPALHDRIHNN